MRPLGLLHKSSFGPRINLSVRARPATSLEHQEGRRVFREGPKFFELCPTHFSRLGKNFSTGASPPCAPVVTGLVRALLYSIKRIPARVWTPVVVKCCGYFIRKQLCNFQFSLTFRKLTVLRVTSLVSSICSSIFTQNSDINIVVRSGQYRNRRIK